MVYFCWCRTWRFAVLNREFRLRFNQLMMFNDVYWDLWVIQRLVTIGLRSLSLAERWEFHGCPPSEVNIEHGPIYSWLMWTARRTTIVHSHVNCQLVQGLQRNKHMSVSYHEVEKMHHAWTPSQKRIITDGWQIVGKLVATWKTSDCCWMQLQWVYLEMGFHTSKASLGQSLRLVVLTKNK